MGSGFIRAEGSRDVSPDWSPPRFILRMVGVAGGSMKIVLERVREGALLVAYGTRDEAHDGVRDDDGRKLAPGQDIVAYRYFFGYQMLTDAVVYAFIVTAKYDYVLEHRHTVGHALVEHLAVGSGEYHLVIVALRAEGLDAAVDRLDLNHHTRIAAEGIVVDLAVAVGSVVAEIMHLYVNESLIAGTLDDGAVQRRLEHLGKHGDYIDTHSTFLSEIFRKFAAAKLIIFSQPTSSGATFGTSHRLYL